MSKAVHTHSIQDARLLAAVAKLSASCGHSDAWWMAVDTIARTPARGAKAMRARSVAAMEGCESAARTRTDVVSYRVDA